MSKKATAKVAEMTPEEKMEVLATRYADLQATKKELDTEIEDTKNELVKYAQENGKKEFQSLTIIESEAKPKLDFGNLNGKAKDRAVQSLLNDLPEYSIQKVEIDTERLAAALPNNASVRNTLVAHSATIISGIKTYTLRLKKSA